MLIGGRLRPAPVLGVTVALMLTLAAPESLAQDTSLADDKSLARDDAITDGGSPLPGIDRESLTDADLAQGTTLLVVWATWSPRCRNIAARIDRLAETWSDRARVASIVFQGNPETVREAILAGDLDAPVYLDPSGDFSQRYEVTTLPMLLIFRGGELAFRGKLSANPDAVIERVVR